jgi:hypothetical protein
VEHFTNEKKLMVDLQFMSGNPLGACMKWECFIGTGKTEEDKFTFHHVYEWSSRLCPTAPLAICRAALLSTAK